MLRAIFAYDNTVSVSIDLSTSQPFITISTWPDGKAQAIADSLDLTLGLGYQAVHVQDYYKKDYQTSTGLTLAQLANQVWLAFSYNPIVTNITSGSKGTTPAVLVTAAKRVLQYYTDNQNDPNGNANQIAQDALNSILRKNIALSGSTTNGTIHAYTQMCRDAN